MADIVFIILLIFGAALVAVLIFGGWATVTVIRLIARVLGGHRSSAPPPLAPNLVRCVHLNCRTDNPARARFCRRCGRMLHADAHRRNGDAPPVPGRPVHFSGAGSA